MKFGALLRTSAQEMPELQGLFNCYKQLKKRLKRLPEKSAEQTQALSSAFGAAAVIAHERAFVALLVSDIQAFNETYVEKEEQSVIKLSLLEERLSKAKDHNEKAILYKDFVNFHGQTLMLVHWSILAYTSVLKILKKHHKRTGLRIQEFNMQQLLSQPFCSVQLTSELVRKAEAKAQELASALNIVPVRTDASFVSSHSSPKAEELMTAARERVREISDSAARGSDALDQHLTDQPSSSEDLSECAGEAEVISSRNIRTANNKEGNDTAQRPQAQAEAHAKRERQDAGMEGAPAEKRPRLDDQSRGDEHQTSHERRVSAEGKETAVSKLRRNCECNMARTQSVAGENQMLQKNLGPVNGVSANSEEKLPPEEANEAGPLQSQPGISSASSGSKSKSKSPELTVGQGWFGGTSENILKQTQMALGLWEQLHETASTPSTVVPPLKLSRQQQQPANSAA